MLNLIKRVHSVVENVDIEKHRQSQDYFGAILGNSKDTVIHEVVIEDIYAEWISVNRAHMKKYVILYCHGGGYSTGSSLLKGPLCGRCVTAYESWQFPPLCLPTPRINVGVGMTTHFTDGTIDI